MEALLERDVGYAGEPWRIPRHARFNHRPSAAVAADEGKHAARMGGKPSTIDRTFPRLARAHEGPKPKNRPCADPQVVAVPTRHIECDSRCQSAQLLIDAAEELRVALRRRAQQKPLCLRRAATLPSTRNRGADDARAITECTPERLIKATRAYADLSEEIVSVRNRFVSEAFD